MSLAGIVRALGGDLYAGGQRASVPGPGHGTADRSVSLLLSGDRVVAHGFAGEDWRQILHALHARGLVDRAGRLTGQASPGGDAQRPPGPLERRAAAWRLWAAGEAVAHTPAASHAARRAVRRALGAALRFHPAAPSAVYEGRGWRRPALLARIDGPDGRFCGAEVLYLTHGGELAPMRTPRKVVGQAPLGSAVRLDPTGPCLVVAEGVFSALSASEALGLPAWACLSANSLARWSPPPGVREVRIAADRDAVGCGKAGFLRARLAAEGLRVSVCLPPHPWKDWNAAAQGEDHG